MNRLKIKPLWFMLLIIVTIFQIPHIAAANPTFDNSGKGSAFFSTTLTITLTITTKADRIAVCSIAYRYDFGAPSTVKIGTSSFTNLRTETDAAVNMKQDIWTLLAPPAGSQSIIITFGAGAVSAVVCMTFSAVLQASPINVQGTSSASTTTPSLTLTTLNDDVMLLYFLSTSNTCAAISTRDGGMTNEQCADNAPSVPFDDGNIFYQAWIGTRTLSWTMNNADIYRVIGIGLNSAGAPSAASLATVKTADYMPLWILLIALIGAAGLILTRRRE